MSTALPMRPAGRRRVPWVGTAVLTLVTLVVTAYAVVPMLLILSGSLTAQPAKIFTYWDPLSWRAFIPPGFSTSSYAGIISGSFGTAMLNSLIVAVATVGIGIVMAVFAAFALSALHFRFREVIFGLVVISFLIPFDAVSIPLSGTFRAWGLSNSLIGLILPGLANGLAVFLLRQFFLGIPGELIDASRIDGMTNRQMLLYVFVPLARPAIIGAGLLLFLAQWQEYLWPLLTITDQNKEVAPVALGAFVTQFSTDFRGMFAAAVLTTALPMALVLLLQRFFTQTVVGTEGK